MMRSIVTLCVLLIVCGCSTAVSPETATTPPVGTASSSAVPQKSANADSELVRFTRSGGFAGRTQTLTVAADGQARLFSDDAATVQVGATTLSDNQVQSLAAAFASTDWQQLDASYGRQVPDGFRYTIVAGGKQVVAYDGTSFPPAFETVLNQLSNIMTQTQQAQPS